MASLQVGTLNGLCETRVPYMDIDTIRRVYGELFTDAAVREDFCQGMMIAQNRSAEAWLAQRGLVFIYGGTVYDPNPEGLRSPAWEAVKYDQDAVEELLMVLDDATHDFLHNYTRPVGTE